MEAAPVDGHESAQMEKAKKKRAAWGVQGPADDPFGMGSTLGILLHLRTWLK